MSEKVVKKQISEKTAIKAIINGFIAYGVLFTFIFLAFGGIITYISQFVKRENIIIWEILISLISCILIYSALHLICKLSNHDLFKKCKLDKEKNTYVCHKLNIFYILCIVFFVIVILTSLFVKFTNQKNEIYLSYYKYQNDLSNEKNGQELANSYLLEMKNDYDENKKNTLIVSVILELGIVFSFISLIDYQKTLIEAHNK